MEARFRADYLGEFVVVNNTWAGTKRTQQREWIPNPIENQHISGRAACIGSRDSLQNPFPYGIDYRILQRHRGGLLGTLKLQTYGTGTIAQDMRLDFTVELNPEILKTLIDTNYYENNVVYTSAKNCIDNPGDFYLVPLNPRLLPSALPIYLAAFDGHQEIFLLGYNKETEYGNDRTILDIKTIFDAYSGVKFYLVGESTLMPDSWLESTNVICMNYKDFTGYADI